MKMVIGNYIIGKMGFYQNKFLLTILLIVIGMPSMADNIMRIGSYLSDMNDTIEIELIIENTEQFIAFQCDLIFPANFTYLNNSAALTSRADGHILIESSTDINQIRVFSYSNSNNKFLEQEGAILKFKVYTGMTPGNYNIEIQDAIIGNDQSQNILTQDIDGYVQVSSNGLDDDQYQVRTKIYPNPVHEILFVEFEITEPSEVEILVYNLKGDLENKIHYVLMMPGIHTLTVPVENIGNYSGGVKFFRLEMQSHHRVWRSEAQKIIVINH